MYPRHNFARVFTPKKPFGLCVQPEPFTLLESPEEEGLRLLVSD